MRRNRAVDDAGEFHVHLDNTGTAATSYVDTDVVAETRYIYRIKAINEHGLSAQSTYVNADTPSPPVPDQPTELTGTVEHDSVSLSWDDPHDDTITGYRILRRNRATDDPGVFHTIEDDTGSEAAFHVDTDVEPETRYVYRIQALNEHGASPTSGYVNADTPPAPAVAEEQQQALPAAPTGLLTAATHDQVLLSWDDPDDGSITGYGILRGADADSLTILVDDTNSASTSYTDHDVEPETAYVYAVRALNASGAGEASVSAAATTQKAPEEPIVARQDSGVCDRTDEVEAAIIAAVDGVDACGDVTSAHLEGIATLDLSSKGIDSLQSGDFAGLTALTELAIQHTSVKSLPSDIFAGLTALTELNFAYSSLESLPAGVFDELTSLRVLDLAGSALTELPAGVLEGVQKGLLCASRRSMSPVMAMYNQVSVVSHNAS